MKNTLFAVIPAYNELKHIASVIKGVKGYVKNVIVVDDGSRDNTYSIAKNMDVIALTHIVNLGKGAALKTGCDYALKLGAKNIIVIDADGQHNPEHIPDFVKALKKSDIVFGCRKLRKDMPLLLKFGNRFIDNVTRILYGIDIPDTQCGFRAFTSNAYKKLRWKANDYFMESEMIANAGKHKLKYEIVPISTIYSDKYKGTTVFDGMKIVINLIFWRLRR